MALFDRSEHLIRNVFSWGDGLISFRGQASGHGRAEEGHYRVPSLYPKRSSQALRPGPPPKPLSN